MTKHNPGHKVLLPGMQPNTIYCLQYPLQLFMNIILLKLKTRSVVCTDTIM